MGEDTRINYAQMIGKEIPSDISTKRDYFNIEISIVMRKPKGHYSRAPGLIWKILNQFNGGTFFQGQGYWQGWQEPVIYLMISTDGEVGKIIGKLESCLKECQEKLKQQMMFAKINGSIYLGNMLDKETVRDFPEQMDFDDDLAKLTSNQSRIDEPYQLIFARVFRQEGILKLRESKALRESEAIKSKQISKQLEQEAEELYRRSYDTYTALEGQLIDAPGNGETNRDLLKCYSNILAPQTRRFMDKESIKKTFEALIWLLPLNQKSSYSDVMSEHAEARIRGNRLKLFIELTEGEIKHHLDYSKKEFEKDGIFAIKQLVHFLNPIQKNKPYLDQDPLEDIKIIMKHLHKISTDFKSPVFFQNEQTQLLKWFPEYSDDIINCFSKPSMKKNKN